MMDNKKDSQLRNTLLRKKKKRARLRVVVEDLTNLGLSLLRNCAQIHVHGWISEIVPAAAALSETSSYSVVET